MNSSQILSLLAEKHSKEVFVPECKNGSSYDGHLRMDAWVMKKSWANPCITVYEIKISRSDFLNDDKWRGYLPYCNKLYFVCPSGMIKPEEVDADAGLMYVAKTGTRIFRKKNALHRDQVIPEDLYRYILMCRSKIVYNYFDSTTPLAEWQNWLKNKKIDREFGYRLGKVLGKKVKEEILEARTHNTRLEGKIHSLEKVAHFLRELNVDPESYDPLDKIRMALEAVPQGLEYGIQYAIGALQRCQDSFDELKAKKG